MGVYNIGPGELVKSNPAPKENPFLLSSAEWLAIQVYVNDAVSLPTNTDELQKSLGPDAPPINTADFASLVACYSAINSHCTDWQKTTFPASISLAGDVVAYAQKAPIYYGAINTEAQKLVSNPNDTQAQAALKAIIDNLAAQATTFQGNAQHVSDMITTFATQTAADKNSLLGPDGTGTQSGIVKDYTDKYGSTSEAVKSLTDQLNGLNELLVTDTKEYNHDVIVASTTPTYAWIWPIGTIAAAIVAGIYGDKAMKALNRIHKDQDQIATLSAQLKADANLMCDLTLANKGITQISSEISNALPIIQKIQGIWGAIATDLTNLGNIIQNDIAQALPIIMNLGVDEAITAWQKLGTEADSYRVNAYITMGPAPTPPAQ
jgi:hypothetical protein